MIKLAALELTHSQVNIVIGGADGRKKNAVSKETQRSSTPCGST
jgi:hypothetical protein